MNVNPYQSPQAPIQQKPPVITGVLSGSFEDLRSIAIYQKIILICILVYLIAVFGYSAIQMAFPQPLIQVLSIVIYLSSTVVGCVFVFMLSIKVYGTVQGVVFGILTLIPCVGLIVLLVVNGKATAILRQNGYQVGLLGANLSKFKT
jgi:hypothetical protein